MSLYTVSITNASGPNSVTIDTSTTPNSINISDGTTLAALTVNTNVSTPLLSDSNPTLSADLNLNGNDITGSGDITTTGDITLTGDMVVSGDLTVNGTTTTLNTQTLDVEDINITVAFGAVDAASANGAGLTVDGADATLTYQSAGDNWALNKPLDVTGSVTVSGTVDGRDVAADGTKLDGIEASADVTDTANVTAAGALMDSEVTNLAQVKAFDSADYATAAQGSTADSAVQPNDSPTFGNITVTGTVDGRDVATDGTKLDGIEASADVTDTANVTAAGALMDSELTDIDSVKALDQGVATSDSPTFAGLTVDTEAQADNIRLTSTTDASLSSTDHAFQVGADASTNVCIDTNEIIARNNGSTSQLNLNVSGGDIKMGNSDTTVQIIGDIEVEDGSASALPFRFADDTDTGLYRVSSGVIGVALNGSLHAQFEGFLSNSSTHTVQTREKADARYVQIGDVLSDLAYGPWLETTGISNQQDNYVASVANDNDWPFIKVDVGTYTTGAGTSDNPTVTRYRYRKVYRTFAT